MACLGRSAIRCRGALTILFACLCPLGVQAQVTSGGDTALFRSDAAGVRIEPEFEAQPLVWGPFQSTISVTAQSVVDSNILRTAKSRGDDIYVQISPAFRLRASPGAHSISLVARVNAKRYSRFPTENKTSADLTLGGRFDLGEGAFANWRTGYSREVEARGEAGSNLISAGPAGLSIAQASASGSKEFGRLTAAVSASVVQRSYRPLRFKSGGAFDQSFRDTRTLRFAPRVSFGVAPSAAFFIAGAATHTSSIDRQQGPDRDAHGYTALAGFRSETSGLVVGEVGVGWRKQQYRNPLFQDFSGFTYDVTVDWYPTQLTSVRLQAGQDIINSGLAPVAGIVRRSLALSAYYDPLRALRVILAIERNRDRFRELAFSTTNVTATLSGRYSLGRHVDISAFGRILSKTSSNTARSEGYDSVAVGVALTGVL